MNNIMGNGGMNIAGTWINRINGQKIQVRDSIIDGDNMIVLLMDGSSIDMNTFSNNYYQMSDDVYDANGRKIENPVSYKDTIGSQLFDAGNDKGSVALNQFSLDEPITKSNQNPKVVEDKQIKNNISISTEENPIKQDINYQVIDKIMSKNMPVCKVVVEWNNLPKSEIMVLKNYFNISDQEIYNYIKDNINIDYSDIENSIKELYQ